MSSSGYNGDSSSQELSPVNWFRSVEPRNTPISTNRTFGLNNLMNGMHSFQSATELQYYIERAGGQGSVVNIADAAYFPILRTSTSQNPSPSENRGAMVQLTPNSTNVVFGLGPNDLREVLGSLSGESSNSPELPPVQPGYERNTFVYTCGIHNSTGDLTPAGSPNVAIFGYYCAVCQNPIVENMHGENLLR